MGAFVVIGTYVLMVLSNVLSSKGVFGKDNKQLSDSYPTYVTPDGLTFAVWGVIYLLETITVVVQAIPYDRTEQLLAQRCPLTGLGVRERLSLAFLANAVWLPAFSAEQFWLALVIIISYLLLLISIYLDVNVATTEGLERLTFAAGIATNASWVVVATMVNGFLFFGLLGWKDANGVAGSAAAAAAACVLVAALACVRAAQDCDIFWAGVAAWALYGIYRMQTIPDKVRFPLSSMSSTLASAAYWCCAAVVLAMVMSIAYRGLVRIGVFKERFRFSGLARY